MPELIAQFELDTGGQIKDSYAAALDPRSQASSDNTLKKLRRVYKGNDQRYYVRDVKADRISIVYVWDEEPLDELYCKIGFTKDRS